MENWLQNSAEEPIFFQTLTNIHYKSRLDKKLGVSGGYNPGHFTAGVSKS